MIQDKIKNIMDLTLKQILNLNDELLEKKINYLKLNKFNEFKNEEELIKYATEQVSFELNNIIVNAILNRDN